MRFETARGLLEEAIGAGHMSGALLAVGRAGEILGEWSAGLASVEPRREVAAGTLFDVGTMTQSLATTSIFMALAAELRLNLNGPVARTWPEFGEEGKDKVSLRHLLKHTSGLPADRPYFQELLASYPGWIGTERGKAFILGRLSSEGLEYPPTYALLPSKLGFLALGHVAELVAGEALESLFTRIVAGPLHLTNARFMTAGDDRAACAATGPCPHRGRMLCGEAADPNAWAMGGAAGHAGLFISAGDAVRIGMALAASLLRDGGWLAQATVAPFIGPKAKYKMGWETPTHGKPECGSHFSMNTIGHTSPNGASLWIDLDAEIAVALFATFLGGTPAGDAANVKSFAALLPPLHDAIREAL